MGYDRILECTCKKHEIWLRGWSYDVLVNDMTRFFEHVRCRDYEMRLEIFANPDDPPRLLSAVPVLAWITGLRQALEEHESAVPAIHWISQGGTDAVAYLEIEDSYWMVEAVWNELIAAPIDAQTVKDRVIDECWKAVVVHGSRVGFPAANPSCPGRFHPSAKQVAVVLAESDLDFESNPIGETFAREIAAIHELAQHAANEGECIKSVCA